MADLLAEILVRAKVRPRRRVAASGRSPIRSVSVAEICSKISVYCSLLRRGAMLMAVTKSSSSPEVLPSASTFTWTENPHSSGQRWNSDAICADTSASAARQAGSVSAGWRDFMTPTG